MSRETRATLAVGFTLAVACGSSTEGEGPAATGSAGMSGMRSSVGGAGSAGQGLGGAASGGVAAASGSGTSGANGGAAGAGRGGAAGGAGLGGHGAVAGRGAGAGGSSAGGLAGASGGPDAGGAGDAGQAPTQSCSTGVACFATDLSGNCQSSDGGTVGDPERRCPPGSACAYGLCGRPSDPASCLRNADCIPPSVCNIFFAAIDFDSACTPPFDTEPAGSDLGRPCDPADDAGGRNPACSTGICVTSDAAGVTASECMFRCLGDSDCGPGGVCLGASGGLLEARRLEVRSCFVLGNP